MKKYDIFEREFDGNILRFQLTELAPRKAAIQLLDDKLQIDKDIAYHLGPQNPYQLASIENGKFVTTQQGDDYINELTCEIYKRMIDWRNSLLWIGSNSSLKADEAEDLVNKLHQALRPEYHPRYLPAVVRWACYGDIAPDSKTDIERMKGLITSYQDHIGIRTKDSIALLGYKVEFKDNAFKRFDKDGAETILNRMNELEEAIRPWLSHEF
jgi:hypothetical protein